MGSISPLENGDYDDVAFDGAHHFRVHAVEVMAGDDPATSGSAGHTGVCVYESVSDVAVSDLPERHALPSVSDNAEAVRSGEARNRSFRLVCRHASQASNA